MDNLQKVFFVQAIGDDAFETESLWCFRDGDTYVIDNIPFIAKSISLGDRVSVEFDERDQVFYFHDFLEASGNTTVRLIFATMENVDKIRAELLEFGCESEVLQQRKIVALNIPRTTNYSPIKQYLDSAEFDGRLVYEESCLMHEY